MEKPVTGWGVGIVKDKFCALPLSCLGSALNAILLVQCRWDQ